MRFRVRVVLCLLALVTAVGCRKPLSPNVDRNQAPETWITAAPFDSVTVKDENGIPIVPDLNNFVIPVRFHMYWAGSDRDGSVVGYYWAVTETTLSTINPDGGPPGPPPPLPGPKVGDYHFTTRTDTTFIFTVSEQRPDRQHGFYIYAVDNQGKVDPTPALFHFIALDKFPPRPAIEEAKATGTIVEVHPNGSITSSLREFFVTDTLNFSTTPRDTVPAGSRMDFRWHGEITLAGTYVTQYRYKLDEPSFVTVDSSVHAVSYGTGLPGSPVLSVGQKVFTLRALDQAGGAGETTRRFIMNFNPDTWFAGPNPALFPPTLGDNSRSVEGWNGVPGTMLSPDSMLLRPALRPQRRTFFEIYKDRVYARSENDTVHINSILAFFSGGYDKDSKYIVRADTTDPALPKDGNGNIILSPVIQQDGAVGSPIGFRAGMQLRTDPTGTFVTAPGTLYPIFEPASVFRATKIGYYLRVFKSGRAYVVTRAEDSDGGIDNTIEFPIELADRVDAGGGTIYERQALRPKIMKFYVNKSPSLIDTIGGLPNPSFRPQPNANLGAIWNLNLAATDVDPFNINDPNARPGGPTEGLILRFKITLVGKNTDGRDTTWTYTPSTASTSPYFYTPSVTFSPPCFLATGPVDVVVELCDCRDCEIVPGEGRCITETYRVNYTTRPAGCPPEPALSIGGPGSASSGSR